MKIPPFHFTTIMFDAGVRAAAEMCTGRPLSTLATRAERRSGCYRVERREKLGTFLQLRTSETQRIGLTATEVGADPQLSVR